MPMESLKLTPTTFLIPRSSDKFVFETLKKIAEEAGCGISKVGLQPLFSDDGVEADSPDAIGEMQQILDMDAVLLYRISFRSANGFQVLVERVCENQTKNLKGNQDKCTFNPPGNADQQQRQALSVAKLMAIARKHFNPTDTRPLLDYLDQETQALYQSREQDLQRLERMQETFFESLTKFSSDQQEKQEDFRRQLEEEYAARQSKLEEQHQERMGQFESKEADLKKLRAEIDERENRQARRDIYEDLKEKLVARNTSYELTKGAKRRRWLILAFSVALMGTFGWGFYVCFQKNVMTNAPSVNWPAIGSQIAFAVAFIGTATFFIRWNNQWFMKHAEEEFKLKRLDLDIDRANWLVELAMEWKNLTKSEIPPELVNRLSRGLFVAEGLKDIDIHPAETLISAVMGRDGQVDLEPGKLTFRRTDNGDAKK